MSYAIPLGLSGLIDDAAVFPPGNAPLPTAVSTHRRYRASWYADLVGPLLLPLSKIRQLPEDTDLAIGVVIDMPLARLSHALRFFPPRATLTHFEVKAPTPEAVIACQSHPALASKPLFVEVPLPADEQTLDQLQAPRVMPKFRLGGDSADLFPTPVALAQGIDACLDRGLEFKLTAGLHRAVRHIDPQTNFTHHGFLNVLVASHPDTTTVESLRSIDSDALVAVARPLLAQRRDNWKAFGSCSIYEPLEDMIAMSLLPELANSTETAQQ